MSFVGNPGGTVVLVYLQNWRDFVPILLVRPRVILSDVLRIFADNRQQRTQAFSLCRVDQVRSEFVLSPGAFPSPP